MVQLQATIARVALLLPMLLSTTYAKTNLIWKTDSKGNPEECPCPAWTRGSDVARCVLFQRRENDYTWDLSQGAVKTCMLVPNFKNDNDAKRTPIMAPEGERKEYTCQVGQGPGEGKGKCVLAGCAQHYENISDLERRVHGLLGYKVNVPAIRNCPGRSVCAENEAKGNYIDCDQSKMVDGNCNNGLQPPVCAYKK